MLCTHLKLLRLGVKLKGKSQKKRRDEKKKDEKKGDCGMSYGLLGTLGLSFPHAVHLEMIVIF